MRRLAAPRDARALDAERAEHDAERQVERLEHRALLDVQLEVGARVSRAARAPRARGRGRRRAPRSASGSATPSRSVSFASSSWSRIEPAAADEPKSERPKRAPSSSAQSTSRTVTGGSPSSAIRRSTSTPASTLRQPSSQPPFGTESMCPPISSACSERPGQREPLVARLVELVDGAGRRRPSRAATRAPAPTSPSRRRAGRRSRRRSARGAPRARRRCVVGSSGIGPRSYNRPLLGPC